MSKFVFPPSIHSRPTYGVLERRDGIFHIIIVEDEGAEAVIDCVGSDKNFLNKTHIIFVATKSGEKYVSRLKSLEAAQFYVGPSYSASVPGLRKGRRLSFCRRSSRPDLCDGKSPRDYARGRCFVVTMFLVPNASITPP